MIPKLCLRWKGWRKCDHPFIWDVSWVPDMGLALFQKLGWSCEKNSCVFFFFLTEFQRGDKEHPHSWAWGRGGSPMMRNPPLKVVIGHSGIRERGLRPWETGRKMLYIDWTKQDYHHVVTADSANLYEFLESVVGKPFTLTSSNGGFWAVCLVERVRTKCRREWFHVDLVRAGNWGRQTWSGTRGWHRKKLGLWSVWEIGTMGFGGSWDTGEKLKEHQRRTRVKIVCSHPDFQWHILWPF